MNLKTELSDREEQLLDDFLGRVRGGAIPNIEALDGFFAALACCPDLVMPSEYLPLVFEDEQGKVRANHWAQGFILGTNLRPNIWPEIMDDENEGGAMVPIWALAYEHHEDPEMRPYDKPISDEQREELIIGAAAGVMRMHRFFLKQRNLYTSPAGTFTHQGGKVGRNEPCPCGSGKKFKQCCGRRSMLH